MSEAVSDAFRFSKLVLATTTYNADVFPPMREFIDHLTERGFKNRTVAFVENGSWAPMAAKVMKGKLEDCKNLSFADTTVTISSSLSEISAKSIEALSEELCKEFDFLILSTTHAHMVAPKTMSVPDRALFYIQRFETLLDSNMPFEKMGIAHPTCPLIDNRTWDNHMQVYDMIPDEIFAELFQRSAEKGLGIELNFPIFKYSDADLERIVRPYRIAKACGCKFYFGSDAHHPAQLAEAKKRFEYTVDVLGLEESDKFLLK
jgi:histidinol phosphatase-like PHP family hydrolase